LTKNFLTESSKMYLGELMLSKRLLLASTLLFVLVSFLFGGSVNASLEMWSRTYGGTSIESAEALVQTSDGGYALAGYTWHIETEIHDFWLVKTDEYGDMEWNQTYGGDGIEYAFALVETSDGGYAIAGTTNNDCWLVKTDAYGNMEWNRTYGGSEPDRAFALVETSDGGYAIAGETTSFNVENYDFWLVKTDANGNMEWNKTYGKATSEGANSLIETSDGGFALAGATTHFGILFTPYSDFWLVKTDAHGNMEWNQTYGKAETEIAQSLVETSDGGYAIAGYITDSPGIRHDFWLVKTDGYGNMEWNQTYGESGMKEAYALVETSDGGFALAGGELLVKTDAYGNMEWNRTYEGVAYALVETSDGGYALAGGQRSSDTESDDFWLAKTDEYGIIPEFPSWAILPLLITASLVILICKQRLPKTVSN
jgi:hypothetical protein